MDFDQTGPSGRQRFHGVCEYCDQEAEVEHFPRLGINVDDDCYRVHKDDIDQAESGHTAAIDRVECSECGGQVENGRCRGCGQEMAVSGFPGARKDRAYPVIRGIEQADIDPGLSAADDQFLGEHGIQAARHGTSRVCVRCGQPANDVLGEPSPMSNGHCYHDECWAKEVLDDPERHGQNLTSQDAHRYRPHSGPIDPVFGSRPFRPVAVLYDKRHISQTEAADLVGRRIDASALRYRKGDFGLKPGEKLVDYFEIYPGVSHTTSMATDRPYSVLQWGVRINGRPQGYVSSNYEGTRHKYWPHGQLEDYDPAVHGEPEPSRRRNASLDIPEDPWQLKRIPLAGGGSRTAVHSKGSGAYLGHVYKGDTGWRALAALEPGDTESIHRTLPGTFSTRREAASEVWIENGDRGHTAAAGSPETDPRVLAAHITDDHGGLAKLRQRHSGTSQYPRAKAKGKLAEMQYLHARSHHHGTYSHRHEGDNTGPEQRPSGWYTGGDVIRTTAAVVPSHRWLRTTRTPGMPYHCTNPNCAEEWEPGGPQPTSRCPAAESTGAILKRQQQQRMKLEQLQNGPNGGDDSGDSDGGDDSSDGNESSREGSSL